MKTSIKNFLFACVMLISFAGQAQTSSESSRVSFTIKNPSLKNKLIGFNSYDAKLQKLTAGYGYGLNALATHAVNLPSPVYVYEEKNGKKELFCVVTQNNDGSTITMNQKYEISREQYLDFAWAEWHLKKEKSRDENSIESIAIKKDIKLIGIKLRKSSWLPSMTHVRYELPWGNDKQRGFSSSMSKFNGKYAILPVGTKIYQCSDKFWSQSTKFTEKLVLTVDGRENEMTAILN